MFKEDKQTGVKPKNLIRKEQQQLQDSPRKGKGKI